MRCTASRIAALVLLTLFSIQGEDKKNSLKAIIVSVQASSTLSPTENYDYLIDYLMDDSQESTWVEGQEGNGIGASVVLTLDRETKLSSFTISNGFGIKKYWAQNSRIKQLKVSTATGEELVVLKDRQAPQLVKLSKELTGNKFSFTIGSVYPGSKFKDTGIADLRIEGWQAPVSRSAINKCDLVGMIEGGKYNVYANADSTKPTALRLPDGKFLVQIVESYKKLVKFQNIRSSTRKFPGKGWLAADEITTMLLGANVTFHAQPYEQAPLTQTGSLPEMDRISFIRISACKGKWAYANYEFTRTGATGQTEKNQYEGWIQPSMHCASEANGCPSD